MKEEGYQLLLLFCYITSPKEILSSNVVSVLKLLVVVCCCKDSYIVAAY